MLVAFIYFFVTLNTSALSSDFSLLVRCPDTNSDTLSVIKDTLVATRKAGDTPRLLTDYCLKEESASADNKILCARRQGHPRGIRQHSVAYCSSCAHIAHLSLKFITISKKIIPVTDPVLV